MSLGNAPSFDRLLAQTVARHLGAGSVIAVGRGAVRLDALGADAIVALDEGDDASVAAALGGAAKDVDVVLDYLWGMPTRDALYAIVPRRADDEQPLSWIQLGSVAGLDSAIPSAALRATNLHLIGSGQGSVSTRDIVSELDPLASAIGGDSFSIRALAVPLRDVEDAWRRAVATTDRLVITPGS